MITVDFSRLTVKPGFKILDIGCGSGRHTCAAYRFKKVIAVGADLKFEDLTEAAERLKLHDRLGEHGGGIWGLAAADVVCLPFKDDCFDLVICSEVLEHIRGSFTGHPGDRPGIETGLQPGGQRPPLLAGTHLLGAFAGLPYGRRRAPAHLQTRPN